MDINVEAGSSDPRGPLLAAWEDAFTAPSIWSESLAAGATAMVEILEHDRDVARTCVLAQLPVTTGGALVWHRELIRSRVAEIMHRQWEACGGQSLPRMHFEVLLGEACTLLRQRQATGDSYADLPDLLLSMWGSDARRPAAADR